MSLSPAQDLADPEMPPVPAVKPADAEAFRAIWRGFGSTVALISTAEAGVRHAMLATAVTSVSMAPASLLICVNRSASAWPALAARGAFALSLMPAARADLAQAIATAASAARFEEGHWAWHQPESGTPLPWLTEAQATLFCETEASFDHGTHRMFIARVVSATAAEAAADPLLYCAGRYGRFSPA